MNYILEIIGFDIASCAAAQEAGASRIELCSSPGEGGTTPSYGFIKSARRALTIPLYVMIRPRGGDFLYSDDEFAVMYEDVRRCKELGADGVVLGMLTSEGEVDIERTAALVEAAYPLGVTFHRAFDRVKDYRKSLRDVIQTGCERILTSGLAPKCSAGRDVLRELVKEAAGDIIIMPGSGVNSENIGEIIRYTGVTEIHSSASILSGSGMHFLNKNMNEVLNHVTVNKQEVEKMVSVLRSL